jgi:preprotein translocase subunit SecA
LTRLPAEAEHSRGRPILVGTASIRESEELATALDTAGIRYALLTAKNDEKEAADIAAAGQRGAVTISTNMAGRGTDIKLGDDPLIIKLGGLYVMGTNKHESRRVDDQLRGRTGRQGDPGLSRFFISLEDDLFERYGVREFLPAAYRQPSAISVQSIDDRIIRKEINRAQAIIAGQNAKIRVGLR